MQYTIRRNERNQWTVIEVEVELFRHIRALPVYFDDWVRRSNINVAEELMSWRRCRVVGRFNTRDQARSCCHLFRKREADRRRKALFPYEFKKLMQLAEALSK